jgi:hypothetical protein
MVVRKDIKKEDIGRGRIFWCLEDSGDVVLGLEDVDKNVKMLIRIDRPEDVFQSFERILNQRKELLKKCE